MSKISDLKEIVLEYIKFNVDPGDIKTLERFDEVLRELDLRST